MSPLDQPTYQKLCQSPPPTLVLWTRPITEWGVWFPTGAPSALTMNPHWLVLLQNPCSWHTSFPQSNQDSLVSSRNLSGTVSNSDLKLAGSFTHDDILASAVPIARLITWNLSDNTTVASWNTKCSNTMTGTKDYLLQFLDLHQCQFRYKPELFHIPGIDNSIADDFIRLWYLNESTYPQTTCW